MGTRVKPGADIAKRLRQTFGANLPAARTKAGLTQRDLEARAGVTQHYVSLLEHGRHDPRLATMAALAEAVGSDVSKLLKEPRRIGAS